MPFGSRPQQSKNSTLRLPASTLVVRHRRRGRDGLAGFEAIDDARVDVRPTGDGRSVAELLGHTYGKTMSFGHYAKESSVQKLKNALERLTYEEMRG